MAPSSNEKRAVRRNQCREVLSKYIYCKLGIEIPPDQVRLPSRPSDPYVWSYHSSKEHLFSASLSRGTIGVYDEICNELDQSIEVVQRASPSKDNKDHQVVRQVTNQTSCDDSFVTQIHRLENEKEQIGEKLQAACETIKDMREEKEKLQSLLEKTLQQATQWKSIAEHHKDIAMAIDKLLRSLNADVHYPDDSLCMEDGPRR